MTRELKYAVLDHNLIVRSKNGQTEFPKCSVGDFIFRKLDVHAGKEIFVDGETGYAMTGQEVKQVSIKLSLALIDLGLGHGDVICASLPNSCIYPSLQLAIMNVGAIYSGIYWTHPARELKHQVHDSRAKFIFAVKENVRVALEVAEQSPFVEAIILVGDQNCSEQLRGSKTKIVFLNDMLAREPTKDDVQIPIPLKESSSEATACILYSSGSTGKPKGVRRTHQNFVASFVRTTAFGGVGQYIVTLHQPMPHASGCWSSFNSMNNGQKSIVSSSFTLENWLRIVDKYRVYLSYLAPAYIILLTKEPDLVSKYSLESLKVIYTGGSPLPASVADVFIKLVKIDFLMQGYGSTEAGGVTVTPSGLRNPHTIGQVTDNFEVKVVNRETGQSLEVEEVGELYARGPEVSPGYWKNPEADKENFTSDGWCKTGDAGFYDREGLFFIVDRYKEVIKFDTCQVPPAELESILLTHPSVREAAVIGIPDEVHGEIPKAFVVVNDGHDMKVDEVAEYVNSQVGDWKRLRGGIQVIDHLPKIGLGKVDRVFLKQLHQQG